MSNHQAALELNKQNTELLGKIAFMLITATTASIAYILTQIKDETWSSLIYFPIYSLILLSLSFMVGCAYLNNQSKILNFNSYILQLFSNPLFNSDMEELNTKLETFMNREGSIRRIQHITFISGAFVYAMYVILSIFFK